MKALLCEALGPAENLVIRDLPEPEPRPGEIAICETNNHMALAGVRRD